MLDCRLRWVGNLPITKTPAAGAMHWYAGCSTNRRICLVLKTLLRADDAGSRRGVNYSHVLRQTVLDAIISRNDRVDPHGRKATMALARCFVNGKTARLTCRCYCTMRFAATLKAASGCLSAVVVGGCCQQVGLC
jgi:hypothetical protein